MALLADGLAVWADANIKLNYFEKQISQANDQLSALLTSMQGGARQLRRRGWRAPSEAVEATHREREAVGE